MLPRQVMFVTLQEKNASRVNYMRDPEKKKSALRGRYKQVKRNKLVIQRHRKYIC